MGFGSLTPYSLGSLELVVALGEPSSIHFEVDHANPEVL